MMPGSAPHPAPRRTGPTWKKFLTAGLRAAAIEASGGYAQACTADTDADLGEQNLAEMITCIRLRLDCTDICTATAAVLSRPAERDLSATRLLVGACAAICQSCGDECERYA